MPTYKLHYFNVRGQGELIRLTLHAAGIPFEDFRVKREEWAAIKESYPTQQLPVLEIDGKQKIPQSASIARYLAATHGLFGKTDLEHLVVDALVETYRDLFTLLIKFNFESDEAKKAELKAKFLSEDLPRAFKNFDKKLKQNKNGDGFFIGDTLTLADIQAMNIGEFLTGLQADCFKAFPKLAAHYQRVRAHPKIAAYLKGRPTTDF